jgi:hypothetical protein
MDPIAIILTIAACLGGLVILYIIGALIMFAFAVHQAKKLDDGFQSGIHRPRNRR